MRTLRFIQTLLILAGSITLLNAAAQRPNIVYFFVDDLGWAGIRANQEIAIANGEDMTEIAKVITPNIDALVAGGLNFTHSYSNPVCSPSRSSQQTGFHQGHTWADWNDPSDDKAMRTQDPTLGKVLAKAGYRNGMYGKWGYGGSKDKIDAVIVNEQTLPINHGYHDCVVELHHVRAHTFLQPTLWYSHVAPDGTVELETTLIDNKKMFPGVDLYADNYYAAGAIKFIREEANGPSPFFIQISFQVPHGPFEGIETIPGWFDDYVEVDTSTWNQGVKQYAGNMTLMDKRLGEVIDSLRDPNNDGDESDSVMANTLLVFASDNGGGSYPELKFFNGNGHLSNYKGSVEEGGIRDPLAFYWEGVIEPGTSTDYKTCITDIFPTFCELADIAPPVGLDGTSIAPLISGEGTLRKRPYFCYESPGNKSGVWSIIRDNMKLEKAGDGTLKLYDLDVDESEQNSLANDPSYAEICFQLLQIALDENLEADNLYANVWPTWIGEDGANVNDAGSWKETGTWEFDRKWQQSATPTASWNASVINRNKTDRTAYLDTSIKTLGFEVSGNPKNEAGMELTIAWDTTLVGRNEIRLSPHSIIKLDGGILESMRWVDIQKDATLSGCGSVKATLYNEGTLDLASVDVAPKRQAAGGLIVSGEYIQSANGQLILQVGKESPFVIRGKASLNGTLDLSVPKGFNAKKGQRFPVLRASSICGEFDHEDGIVISGDQKFRIHYGSTMVELEEI